MTTMTAVRVTRHGDPDVLSCVEMPVPDPAEGQLRVRSAAAGVNFIDVYLRTGAYPNTPPFTLGLEGAGTVEAVGPDVTGFSPGDRVAWAQAAGSYASHVLVPAALAVKVPDSVELSLAAACMLQGMTAHYLTHGVRTSRSGEVALVHAAAGGTGLLLVQMLKAAGLTVIGTCSTEEKAALASAAGADHVVRYREEDFSARARELTDGRGVDVVYDSVGATTFDGGLSCLRPRGLMCLFGQASGPVPPLDLQRLNQGGSLFVTRPSLFHYASDRIELEARAHAVLGAIADGSLQLRIGARYPLAEAAEAHRALEGRQTTGKLLLET